MNVSREFIKRPVMTTLVMAAIVIFGGFGYYTLPVSELPNIDFPTINVSANLAGADPETMASAVATPLENAFSTIPGIDSMTSSSSQGRTNITLQFRLDRNVDAAAQDVQAAISGAVRRLPRGMQNPPTFRKNDPSAAPVFFLSLHSSTLPISKVDEFARNVFANQISTLPGVGAVDIFGGAKYAVRIQADPNALAARKMGINELAAAASANNSNQASGTLNNPDKTAIVQAEGQLRSAEEFSRQIVTYRNGAPVRFGDVADVVDSLEDVRSINWVNDERAITVAIRRQPGSNTIAVVEGIKEALPQLEARLPSSIGLKVLYDRSVTISASVKEVQMHLVIAAILVVGVIFVFLRTASATIIPSLALPITVIGTFAGMSFLGFSLDNLSLMALTLSVGFVVDDAIVMLENIIRHVEAGEDPHEAAMRGSAEIGFTILSMTASLAAVFIPLVFMGGIVGRLLHEFAMTIIIAILVSGLVSITLTPMLCARWLKSEHEKTHNAFYRASERAFDWMRDRYDQSLRWSLNHKRSILGVFVGCIVASAGLFHIMQQDFLPSDDIGQLRGNVQTAVGTGFEQNVAYVRQVMDIVQQDPNVEAVRGDQGGGLFIVLKPLEQRDLSADEISNQLRAKLANIPGVLVTITNPPSIRIGGRSSRSSYQYTLQGIDLEELRSSATRLVQAMQKNPVFVGVNSDEDSAAPSVRVDIDRDRASALGVTSSEIQSTLGAALGGQQVSQIYGATDQYPVILELKPEYQRDLTSLSRIYLTGANGAMIPLTAVTKVTSSTMPQSIHHAGQTPAITVSFDLAPGKALSDAVSAVEAAAREAEIPAGISGAFAGTAAAFQESTQNMGVLLLLAMIVVYIVLGILYESFIHPLTILSGLPTAAVGALLTLYLTGIPLTLYAFVGMIMLIGIVKKNAIMMIDFALHRQRADGISAEDAIFEAAIIRFRPIMMTTMAAMAGTLPIAFGTGMGAEARRPLGLCVAGGLLFSQLLTLYITPVLYIYLDGLSARFAEFRRRRSLRRVEASG